MAAPAATTPGFLNRFPQDCQGRLAELHGKVAFSEDSVEAFEVNNGALNADKLPDFQAFLEKEIILKQKPTPASSVGGIKKAFGSLHKVAAFLPSGLTAALGRSPPKGAVAPIPICDDIDSETPVKRLRLDNESTTPGQVTNAADQEPAVAEPPRKTLEVTLRSSLNDRVVTQRVGPAVPAMINVLGDPKLWQGTRNGRYTWMDESLKDKGDERDKRLAEAEDGLIEAMRKKHPEIEELVVGVIGVPSQAEVVLCGRVLCEGLEGRLNERAMLLEGSRISSKATRVQLNVSGCQQIAVFPGQLVAVLGRSGTTGTTFHARDLVPGMLMPTCPAVVAPGLTSLLHMLVLAGPFCTRDGLDYTPLAQALEHAAQTGPQVVIIIGPLVDSNNKTIANGEAKIPEQADEDDPLSFEEVYREHVLPILRKGLQDLKRTNPATEVLLMPSLEDALEFHPLPQPPIDTTLPCHLGAGSMDAFRKMGVQFLPNPVHLDINGLKVTLTSADALSPVLRSGLVLRPEDKKIEQALRLLIQQRNLFPVLPREPAQVCEARAGAFDFPEGSVPDVLIFPSASGTASGCFIDGRLYVNPGTVCRPAAIGSFAEIYLAPPPASGGNASLSERARVDIKTVTAAA